MTDDDKSKPDEVKQTALERLIEEGRADPPTRREPLPEPLKIDGSDPYALSRALDETRGDR